MNAGPWGGAALMAAVMACFAAPAVTSARNTAGLRAALVAWLPPAIDGLALGDSAFNYRVSEF